MSSIQKGRSFVIAAIAISILVSLANSVFVSAIVPNTPAETVRDGVRFVLTLVLCYFLYQGYGWARWTMGVLLGLGAVAGIGAGLAFLSRTPLALWLIIIGLLYAIAAWLLLGTADVKAFMAAQRSQRGSS